MARVFKFYWEIQKRSKLKVTNAGATPVTAKKKYHTGSPAGEELLFSILS